MALSGKKIIFDIQAKEKIKKAINELCDAAAITLGPKGRNVGISSWAKSKITNDGNSVVNEVELKDPFENLSIKLVKDTINKIKKETKDGTTTSLVILRSLINDSFKHIRSGASTIGLKNGLKKSFKQVIESIDKMSIKISDEDLKSIAKSASSFDEKISEDILSGIKIANDNENIIIESSNKNETEIDCINGYMIQRSYLSRYFCTNQENQIVELNQAKVLVTDKKIKTIYDLLNILKEATKEKKDLLIIADDIDQDVISTLVINKLKGFLKVAAIKAPAVGVDKKEILKDIASFCNSSFFSEEDGALLKNASLKDLKDVKKVQITKDKTFIINPNNELTFQRIKVLKQEISLLQDSIDIEKFEKRISNLKGRLVSIKVGANSDIELKEKKQRYQDALSSCKNAILKGVIPGGGICLLKACKSLDYLQLTEDETIAKEIVKKALQAPVKQIIENAGFDYHLILNKLIDCDQFLGFDVTDGQVKDFIKAKILDPTLVVKNYLSHVISLANIIMLSDVMITD